MWVRVSQNLYNWSEEEDVAFKEAVVYTCFHTDVITCHQIETYKKGSDDWKTVYSVIETYDMPHVAYDDHQKPHFAGETIY